MPSAGPKLSSSADGGGSALPLLGNNRPHLYVGRDCQFAYDLPAALQAAIDSRFDFLVAPLCHPRFRRDARGVSAARPHPFTRSDRLFESSKWSNFVVGSVSRWLDFESSAAGVRMDSEAALEQELQWATHLAVPAVLAPPPPTRRCANYAHALNTCMHKAPGLQVWVEVPLVRPAPDVPRAPPLPSADGDATSVGGCGSGADGNAGDAPASASLAPSSSARAAASSTAASRADGADSSRQPVADAPEACGAADDDDNDPWEAWNTLRVLCRHNPLLSVALVVTEDLCDEAQLQRWLAEPLRAVVLPTSVFVPNRQGFPALTRAHQQVCHSFVHSFTHSLTKSVSQTVG
jgi:protein arginine N-methyltransferase 5